MRRIALVGTASSGAQAPYDDPTVEIWGVSARASYVTRADRWFEIHRLEGEPKAWADKWRDTIRRTMTDIPVFYMIWPERDLHPHVKQYPTAPIFDRFGTYFMTSTFSYMMAMAIDELRPIRDGKIDFSQEGEISISGVDMEYGTEYRQQRAGLRHFMDLARFLGITVSPLASGGLAFEPTPYPMWQDDPLINKLDLRMKTIHEKLERDDDARHRTRIVLAQNAAVIAALKEERAHTDAVWETDLINKRVANLEVETASLQKTYDTLDRGIVESRGAFEQLAWLKDYMTP